MKPTSLRRWDWYTAVLLVAIVFTAAARLSITNWTVELGYVETAALLGTILGLALGTSRLGRRIVLWLVFDYTMILMPWQMMGIVSGNMGVLERLANTGERLSYTFGQLIAARRIDDPIFFVTLMLILYWILSMVSAYGLMRGGTLLSVLIPPTIPMLVIQYYDISPVTNRIWILALYFILILLLMGRVNILRKRETWQVQRVFTGSEPEFDMGAGVLIVAIALVVIAWLAPTPAAAVPAAAHLWQDLNQPLESARARISNMLAAIESGTRGFTEIYGNSLSLGVNARQGTDEVFSVTPPSPDFSRYYWRMRVYDTYQAGNWLSSPGFSEAFSSEQADLAIPAAASARVGDFLIRWKTSPTILLAIPSQPVWVSRTGQVQLADAGPKQVDVLSWHTDVALLAGDQYTARAILIDPSVADLRRAGTDYPDWVKAHDLQTPDNLPQDIRALAKSLTQAQSTPYDKTDAITSYLRREITYSLSVPSLPAGVEPLERFLFTWKSGFCNYYASAEVMLLRSAGVPARLAVGYAQGVLQSNGTFIIQEQDSHAWPEVYFPGVGWVNFEPTTSQPAIVRTGERTNQGILPAQATAGPNVRPPVKKLQEDQNPAGRQTAFPYQTVGVWVIILILASIVVFYLRVLDRKKPLSRRLLQWVRQISKRYGINMPTWLARWERWSESTEVERAFQAINQSLGWLGKPQPLHATPAERAEQLKNLLPSLAAQVDILNEQLEQTLFSPTPGDPAKAVRAAWMIRYLTIRGIMQRWLILGAKR